MMQVRDWRRRCCAFAACGCLVWFSGCGANVYGPLARWRYQLSIQRPFLIEPERKGLPAPLVGDPAPCDINRCPVRHTRSLRTLPQEPTGLPPQPNFHPVPTYPVFYPGPVTYGGSPPPAMPVQPEQVVPPAEELKQLPPPASMPVPPPDAQSRKGWYHAPTNDDVSVSDGAIQVSNEEIVDSANSRGQSRLRFVGGR